MCPQALPPVNSKSCITSRKRQIQLFQFLNSIPAI